MNLSVLTKSVCLGLISCAIATGCTEQKGPFADDVAFMKEHTNIVMLSNGDAAVAVAPEYQGRVMTSSFDQHSGPSFGWINRPVIANGFLTAEEQKGKLEDHIYIFGGEERFWFGPEGGQFGLFFKPGDKFEFSDWKTPAVIDTEAFSIVTKNEQSVKFAHEATLVNYSGTEFDVGIERTVELLSKGKVSESLGINLDDSLKVVAYKTDNRVTNRGQNTWTAETGLVSIWILGMYNPSPETTVVIPFESGPESKYGAKVNDAYFGKVPADYLKVTDSELFFKGDGTKRGKIGISDKRSKGIAGSYDAAGQVLNIVTYNQQAAPNGYVNSMWELQDQPYAGDVINSYNDGSPEPGVAPLGPFYELETSSPAAALKPGQSVRHIQTTYHIQGPEAQLDVISKSLFGVNLNSVKTAFKE
ncbi:hypothetical protein KO525_10215 [Psychrosphaera sp. B3R10]|uniref:DUF6786 family protein n=1 Tax=unclassified Psychrosphaera TaxID=2641570 RepID=UPI001C086CC6|nr:MULTISPECIES: DUF6786 family protein [unclassified Psychrosphaera]MBU2883573.1 hypothetical protein [Psychrosphaera sp. I2R16]MBU2989751.1 hypothetical protein [Psychrosphaera sp. B3R10]